MTAAERAVEAGAGAGSALQAAADAWSDRAGGTSGVLWGIALGEFARVLGDDAIPSPQSIAAGVRAGADSIAEFGRARIGDKTMLDAYYPFADALDDELTAGATLGTAWSRGAAAAGVAAAATASMTPRIGRARPLAEQSIGTPDPGAVSFALAMDSIVSALWQHIPQHLGEK